MPATYVRISDRHPFELYLLVLSLMSSLPAAIGAAPAPASIRIQLDPGLARVWACSLALGALVALLGLAWKRPKVGLSITALLLEQVGLVITGVATIYYAIVALSTIGASALTPVGTVLAFGLASFAQAEKIQLVIYALNHPDEPLRVRLIVRAWRRIRPLIVRAWNRLRGLRK